ncbi:2-hydroxyacid dehydrogenase [Rhizobium sp. S152]|uniref:2-hydroxyacid dehydrogenase n=1 Tax=Rhizobium sp. S152 TaxID=3055038 RepID=UPI0025AA1F2A|nr:2-hydroxyacid dehydrogenase [Rhizobium sp. S152]MDM9627879.1 2-hydroxyacid dehydrogenase [Rhizobium sp. S152]
MSEKIVLLDKTSQERANEILPHVPEGMTFVHGVAEGTDYLKEIIRDADYAIAGQVAVTGEVLRAATKLRLLHKSGVGVDNIDIASARELGIMVARTPGSNAVPVAEFALGSAIAALRGLAYGNANLKNGEWRGPGKLPNKTFILTGKTVGIIGFGAIGQAFAKLLQGFGCTILYSQRSRLVPERERELKAAYASLDQILETADLISLNCPLTSETANLIDRAAFSKMKPSAVLVNVARGGIVVEKDLIWALENRIIAAAAVDVFEQEPLPADSPLLRPIDNLVLTPHIAAVAADTFAPTLQRIFRNIVSVAKGEAIAEGDRVV